MQRIIVPYLFWSGFYLISKSIIFLMNDHTSKIQKLFFAPLAIILFGAASYHLYFLPLLANRTLLLCLANYFSQKQNSLALLSLFSVLSIVVYQLLLTSNNSFDLDTYTAFDKVLDSTSATSWNYSILRILLVNLSWILRCLPYFLISILLNRFLLQNNYKWLYKQQTAVLLFFGFLSINIMGENFIPSAVNEIAIAFLLLLWGISISHYFKDNKNNAVITNLGLCSFGIYLIHPLVKSVVEIIIIKLIPPLTQSVSLTSILVYSVSSFLISWVLVAVLLKNKVFSQYM
ncbi:acyltransferase family protein [Pleurocapsa sp. FMAR1]|uniref:acyltransferase family protein n=1 Tax=Pleurocapsa sp. FMAR1 TaxID=3040204 RepID=UPI0029C83BC9|nr:acyltransferase family protein [Pleurocapsa sp. FMAR1]